jgi:branched-chain amino acid transport system permease protein
MELQQAQPAPTTATTAALSPRQYGSTLIALGVVVGAFVVLMTIDPSSLLYPLWSSIAFPILAVVPFLIVAQKSIPWRIRIPLLLIMMIVLLPILGIRNGFYFTLAMQIGMFAAMALGLNIVVGFAGLLDLGYVAFFAVGAYLWGIFTSQTDNFIRVGNMTLPSSAFPLFLFISLALAAVAGILLGLPVLRLRGDYLAIVTLGFGEMIRILLKNLDHPVNITNGALGLDGIASPPVPQFAYDLVDQAVRVLSLDVSNTRALTLHLFFYFLVLIICGLAVVVTARVDNSPIGRAWTAIREDETAALAMGVPLVKMKLLAFATGASFAGAMGVIFAAKFKSITPDAFDFNQSIFILAIVIVGGMGSIRGVLLGAAVVTLLNVQILQSLSDLITNLKNQNVVIPVINFAFKDWPNQLELAKYQRFVFGLMMILIVLFRPAGLLPATRRKMEIESKLHEELPPEPPVPEVAEMPTDPALTDSLVDAEADPRPGDKSHAS